MIKTVRDTCNDMNRALKPVKPMEVKVNDAAIDEDIVKRVEYIDQDGNAYVESRTYRCLRKLEEPILIVGHYSHSFLFGYKFHHNSEK